MTLKNIVIDRDERAAMELLMPVFEQLWPRDAQALYDGIVAALRSARAGS